MGVGAWTSAVHSEFKLHQKKESPNEQGKVYLLLSLKIFHGEYVIYISMDNPQGCIVEYDGNILLGYTSRKFILSLSFSSHNHVEISYFSVVH